MIGLSGARRRSHQYVNEQPFSERKLVAYEEAKRLLFQQHQHQKLRKQAALEAFSSLRRVTTSSTGTQHLLNYDQHDEYEQTKLLEVRRKDKILREALLALERDRVSGPGGGGLYCHQNEI